MQNKTKTQIGQGIVYVVLFVFCFVMSATMLGMSLKHTTEKKDLTAMVDKYKAKLDKKIEMSKGAQGYCSDLLKELGEREDV
jgi:hypothetical protein